MPKCLYCFSVHSNMTTVKLLDEEGCRYFCRSSKCYEKYRDLCEMSQQQPEKSFEELKRDYEAEKN